MKRPEQTGHEKEPLIEGFEPEAQEAQEDKEQEERERKFEKSQMKVLRMNEWKVLFALAYDGPRSMFSIAKTYKLQYASVHRATKSLEEVGWVKVMKTGRSEKNVDVKIYGLTAEGLLWVFSRIPKTFYEELLYASEGDPQRVRKPEQDKSKWTSIETDADLYVHLLLDFDFDMVAQNNTVLFPLIFEKWNFFKEIDEAQFIASDFPEVAFSALVAYYNGYEPVTAGRYRYGRLPAIMDNSLEMIFTCKLYYTWLKRRMDNYAGGPSGFAKYTLERALRLFLGMPELQDLMQEFSKRIRYDLLKSLEFIKYIKARFKKKRSSEG